MESVRTPSLNMGEVIEPPQIFGDVNKDGVVNIQDLVLVGSNFRQTGQNRADVNSDGIVDIVDLVLVAGAIRNAATAPAVQPRCTNDIDRRRCPRLAHSSTGSKPHGCNVPKGNYLLRTPLGNVDPKRDTPVAQLPEPVQPGDMDTVSPRSPRRCHAGAL